MTIIEGLINILGSLESDKIAVHEERCVSVRHKRANCLRCAEACTSGAISYTDNNLTIDPSLCIGCGSCATACPTCAIELRSPTDAQMVAFAKKAITSSSGHPVFACETALQRAIDLQQSSSGKGRIHNSIPFDGAQIVGMPCLGRIDEALLCAMAAYGCRSTHLVCDDCEHCIHRPGGLQAREVVKSAQNLLDAFGSTMPISLDSMFPPHVRTTNTETYGGTNRREFFESIKTTSSRVAGDALQKSAIDAGVASAPTHPAYRKVNADGTLSRFTPERRTRLFNYLRHIGDPTQPQVTSRIIGSVHIESTACSSCRMCATFCPTGALLRAENHSDGFFGIVHRPTLCMQCRLCESICPTGALSISSTVPSDLFIGKKAECVRMTPPDWTPNKPDSMFQKIHNSLGDSLPMTMF